MESSINSRHGHYLVIVCKSNFVIAKKYSILSPIKEIGHEVLNIFRIMNCEASIRSHQ